MKKETFWRETSRYGAMIGGVEVVCALLKMLTVSTPWLSMLLSLMSTALLVTLLYLFTKRRSMLYGEAEGYSYGDGLKFIISLSLFAGIILGAYEIFARNMLFVEIYREAMNLQLLAFQQNPMLTQGMSLSEIKELFESIMFSPLWVVFSAVLGLFFSYLFFGLFIAAFTRREVNVFSSEE